MIDHVIPRGEPLIDFDVQVPLMSLPGIFKTTQNSVPNDIPYLHANPNLVTFWKDKLVQLGAEKTFNIGICWQGNTTYRTQALKHAIQAKSLRLDAFKPIANIPGVSLFSLQKINGLEQIESVQDKFVIHTFDVDFDETHGRFMDTAALMKNLNLIITIDTSIAHVAGGLGIPTLLMLPNPADWRWIINRTDTPWYPEMKLFKQPTPGDWKSVIESITSYLKTINSNIENRANLLLSTISKIIKHMKKM